MKKLKKELDVLSEKIEALLDQRYHFEEELVKLGKELSGGMVDKYCGECDRLLSQKMKKPTPKRKREIKTEMQRCDKNLDENYNETSRYTTEAEVILEEILDGTIFEVSIDTP